MLEREFNRLVEDYGAIRFDVDELRRSAPERLRAFESASNSALQYMGERRFDLALDEIRKAETDLAEMQRLLAVSAELRSAAMALASLEETLPAMLVARATPRVLRRLQDLARSLLNQGEARKAHFVVLLLRNQLDLLQTHNHEEPTVGLQSSLRYLEAVDGAAARHIDNLIIGGYHHLAERLSEDVCTDLVLQDRRRRASEMPEGSLAPIMEALKLIHQRADSVMKLLARWIDNAS